MLALAREWGERFVASVDQLTRTLSDDGAVTVRVVEATATVAEAARRHQTSPLASVALGRSLMGALLLASGSKEAESVQLSFEGVGALRRVTAIANSQGEARGFVSDPQVGLDDPGLGLDVGGALVGGTLSVIRSREGWKEPYTGIVVLESGQIAEDIARYLLESEQIPSVIALGVLLDEIGGIASAAGFLAQALPGATEEEISLLEENAGALPNPSALVRHGLGPEALCERLLEGVGHREIHHQRVRFHCGCSFERAKRGALLLPVDELRELEDQGESVEVRCAFCTDVFHIEPTELMRAREET